MEANGYKGPCRRTKQEEEGNRFQARRPLELSKMDILDFFMNKLKACLLILPDDFSRFVLVFRLSTQSSIDESIDLVQEGID